MNGARAPNRLSRQLYKMNYFTNMNYSHARNIQGFSLDITFITFFIKRYKMQISFLLDSLPKMMRKTRFFLHFLALICSSSSANHGNLLRLDLRLRFMEPYLSKASVKFLIGVDHPNASKMFLVLTPIPDSIPFEICLRIQRGISFQARVRFCTRFFEDI